MYRCEPCKAVCRGTMKRHLIRRPDNQIAREVPVCGGCKGHLDAGMPIEFLLKHVAKQETKRESVVVELTPKVVDGPTPAAPTNLLTGDSKPAAFEFRSLEGKMLKVRKKR